MNYIKAVRETDNGKEVFYSGDAYNETNCRLVLDGNTPLLNTSQGLKPVPRGCIFGDWELVEEPKPKSLSDKHRDVLGQHTRVYDYTQEDVKAHLKRFLEKLEYEEAYDSAKLVHKLAKEEFGTRLV